MNQREQILVALDGSDASMRAVNYMADAVRGNANYQVSLLHVLDPLPPKLREFAVQKTQRRKKNWKRN